MSQCQNDRFRKLVFVIISALRPATQLPFAKFVLEGRVSLTHTHTPHTHSHTQIINVLKSYYIIVQVKMGTLLHYVKKLKRKKAFFFKTLAVSNVIPTEKKRRRGGKKGPGSENIMSQL